MAKVRFKIGVFKTKNPNLSLLSATEIKSVIYTENCCCKESRHVLFKITLIYVQLMYTNLKNQELTANNSILFLLFWHFASGPDNLKNIYNSFWAETDLELLLFRSMEWCLQGVMQTLSLQIPTQVYWDMIHCLIVSYLIFQ